MALANQAVWETLREVYGINDDDLYARMEEFDLRDGSADGKMGRQVLYCPVVAGKPTHAGSAAFSAVRRRRAKRSTSSGEDSVDTSLTQPCMHRPFGVARFYWIVAGL